MATPKLSKLELQIMEKLWDRGQSSIREIQEAFPRKGQAGLHDYPDDYLPDGSEEGRPPSQEGR